MPRKWIIKVWIHRFHNCPYGQEAESGSQSQCYKRGKNGINQPILQILLLIPAKTLNPISRITIYTILCVRAIPAPDSCNAVDVILRCIKELSFIFQQNVTGTKKFYWKSGLIVTAPGHFSRKPAAGSFIGTLPRKNLWRTAGNGRLPRSILQAA